MDHLTTARTRGTCNFAIVIVKLKIMEHSQFKIGYDFVLPLCRTSFTAILLPALYTNCASGRALGIALNIHQKIIKSEINNGAGSLDTPEAVYADPY